MTRTSTVSKRGILRPSAAGTQFQLARFAASPALDFFVERYWMVQWDLRAPFTQELVPHPCVNFVVERGRSGVFGPGTRKDRRELVGRGRAFGAKFKPGAFFPYLGIPVSQLANEYVPIGDAFGDAGVALERRVLACRDEAKLIALFDAFLLAHRPAIDAPSPRALASVALFARRSAAS